MFIKAVKQQKPLANAKGSFKNKLLAKIKQQE